MAQEDRKKKKYKQYEDLNFPIGLLGKGLIILENHGHVAFRNFCNRVQMPTQDVERVLNKHKLKTDAEFRKEIKAKWSKIKSMFGGEIEIPF